MRIEVNISKLFEAGRSPEEVVRELLGGDLGKDHTPEQICKAVNDYLDKKPGFKSSVPGLERWMKENE